MPNDDPLNRAFAKCAPPEFDRPGFVSKEYVFLGVFVMPERPFPDPFLEPDAAQGGRFEPEELEKREEPEDEE